MKKFVVLLLACILCAWPGDSAFAVIYGRGGYETQGYSESTAWEINSAEVLAKLRDDVNAGKLDSAFYVKLTKDIDLTDYQRWIPIGGTAESYFEEPRYTRCFKGHFNGDGHTITVNISELETDRIRLHHGIFGIILGGSIKNLNVSGKIEVFMRASSAPILVGGIASYLVSGSIENCRFNGNITAENLDGNFAVGTLAGGIVARAGYSFYTFSIKSCRVGSCSDTVITASDALAVKHTYAGGIAAYLDYSGSSTVLGNYIRAEMNAQYLGGLYATCERSTGIIKDNTEDDPSEPPPDTASITITTASFPSGNIGDSYSESLTATTTGGTWPVTWALTSGTLPAGLTLNSDGTISGSPTAKGTYKFTVKASIGSSGIISATKEYTITIADNQPSYSLTVKNESLSSGTVNKSYAETLKAELTGAELPASWSYTGTLPPGLTLNTSGTITGTPTQAGEYTFTVKAVFGAFEGTKSFTLKITSGSDIDTPWADEQPGFTVHEPILSGQIIINFYADLPQISGVDYNKSYVDFDIAGDKTNVPQMFDPEFNANVYGKTNYAFRCYLNSVQMADEITATLHYGDNKTVAHTYSLKEYIDTQLSKSNISPALKNILEAMKDYGHYAQLGLSEANGWTIGKDHKEMECANVYTDDDLQETLQAVRSYEIVRDTGNSGIESVPYRLRLDSDITLELNIVPASDYYGSVFASLNGGSENMAVKTSGGYLVQISGISAHKLGDTYTVTVTTSRGSFDVKVSALSYVYTSLTSANTAPGTTGSPAMKKAVTSLYKYYMATMAYRESIGMK